MSSSDTEVAVIGGGAAGIAAARRLHEAGVACVIIEARPRLGGRAWTVTDPDGHGIDLGCGWLHSADRNPWRAIAQAQGLTLDDTPPPWTRPALPVGFSLADQHAFLQAQHRFYERLAAAEHAPDQPASALLEPGGRWNALLDAVNTYVSGAELAHVSAVDLARYDDSNINWRVVDGLGTAIAGHGVGLAAALDCPVQRIDHGSQRLRIETQRGTFTADQAIVTLPSAVIAQQPDLFAPHLPAKTEAAAGLPLGLADKLFLALDQPDEFEADSRLFGRTDSVATATYHLRPFGRPQIEAYFGGSLAAELEQAGDAAFTDFAVGQLKDLLGNAFARRVRPLCVHAWRRDPFARGSYSYARPGHAEARAVLAASVDDRLFFAGEACSLADFSTAHGAYLTGAAAAETVIAARGRR